MIGDTTRDILELGTPHPAETDIPTHATEAHLRKKSRRALTWGAAILAYTYLGTLTVSVLIGHGNIPAIESPTIRLLATLGLVTLHTLGLALILIAGFEWVTRPMRALVRQTASTIADTRLLTERTRATASDGTYRIADLEQAVKTLTTQIEELNKRADETNARLDSLDIAMAKVPTYAQGVIDGITSRSGTNLDRP